MSKRALLLVILTGTCLIFPIFGQPFPEADGPSLEETIAWLKGRLKSDFIATENLNSTPSPVRFYSELQKVDGCRVTLYQMEAGPFAASHATYVIPLGEVSPDGLDITRIAGTESDGAVFRVTGTVKDSRELVFERFFLQVKKKDLTPLEFYTKSFSFVIKDKDVAERCVKALSHAITLCGGKPELF